MQIDQQTLTFILAIVAMGSVIFTIYNSYRNPQIKTDLTTSELNNKIVNLQTEIKEIKETHLRTLENEIKGLTLEIGNLKVTMVKLSTIIEERIPKGNPSLTPPGV